MKIGMKPYLIGLLLSVSGFTLAAESWLPVTGAEKITDLFSDKTHKATLKKGVKAESHYNRDGSGELRAWGDSFKRQWRVEGDNQICILIDSDWACFNLEQGSDNQNRYRATDISSKEQVTFVVSERELVNDDQKPRSRKAAARGGAVKPSADEMARKLANPNAPLASLNFKLQYRGFKGDLPNADDQDSITLLFQPTFPFPQKNGDTIFFRPAIPLLIDQPYFDSSAMDFDDKSGMGDITFDLAYGRTTKSGLLFAGGIVSTIPTATEDELGNDRWTLGPEFMIGKLSKNYVLGMFPSHQWDVGGSGDKDINLTLIQLFGVLLPGGGWNYGSSPILSYDHEIEQWTIPLNLTLGKTVIMGGRPWKLGFEINYYTEQPDSFGPKLMIGINVSPVVENVFASLFK